MEPFEETPFDDGWNGTVVVRHQLGDATGRVEVIDNAFSEELAAATYQYTVDLRRSWGSYVTLEAALSSECDDASNEDEDAARCYHLARELVRAVWLGGHKAAGDLFEPLAGRVHGFAVWANAGCVGEECAYHLDYAELHRRHTGKLHPPLLASTLHVSQVCTSALSPKRRMLALASLANVQFHSECVRVCGGYRSPKTAWLVVYLASTRVGSSTMRTLAITACWRQPQKRSTKIGRQIHTG